MANLHKQKSTTKQNFTAATYVYSYIYLCGYHHCTKNQLNFIYIGSSKISCCYVYLSIAVVPYQLKVIYKDSYMSLLPMHVLLLFNYILHNYI